MINGAILISGRGSNMKALLSASKSLQNLMKFKLVISDRNTPALKHVENLYGKKNLICLNLEINSSKEKITRQILISESALNEFEQALHYNLIENEIQLICLAGFMKILSSQFVKKWKNKILNIHPSLLPAYPGLNTHRRVLENKEKWHGCTVHIVTDKLDSGKILCQKRIPILKNETETLLANRVLKEEHLLYIKALKIHILSDTFKKQKS